MKTSAKPKADDHCAAFVTAFARQAAIRDAGLYEAFEDAEATENWEACDLIAAQVGYPYDPPRAASEARQGGFAFARVGEQLASGLKPIQWLVRSYVEADSLALMFGDPGCGKSFAAIDLACCIATGTPWHGNKTTPGAVFYIAGEGQNGLMRRFAAWAQNNRISLGDAPLFVGHRPAQLVNAATAAEVANAVEEMQDDAGQAPALIVVDTLARNFGGDENSQEDMGAFIANLDAFLRKSGEWNATVLVVHHSGHADKSRSRGSSALKGAVDAEYSLTKDEAGVVRMEATKMKDAEQPAPVAFQLETVVLDGLKDDEGEPVTSAVLWSVPHVAPAKAGKAGRGKNQTLALSVLADLVAEKSARLERSGHNPDGARVTVDEWRERLIGKGINRNRFYEVRDRLKDAGSIVVEYGGYVRLAGDEAPL